MGPEEVALLDKKRLLPGMLDSFMSLSGMLYSVAYGIVASISLICMATLIHKHWGAQPWHIAVAGGLGLIFGSSSQLPYYRAGDTRKAVVRLIAKIIAITLIVTLFVLVSVNIFVGDSTIGIFTAGIAAMLLAWLGRWLLYELQLLRTGTYAPEACARAWSHVLIKCFPDD